MFFWNVIKVIAIISVLDVACGQLPSGTKLDIYCLPAKLFGTVDGMATIEVKGTKVALLSLLPYEIVRKRCSNDEIPVLTYPMNKQKNRQTKETPPNPMEKGWPPMAPRLG